jgi:hypothetical protein
MFRGGLWATAFASTLAAPMMIEAGRGLIVIIPWVLDRPHGVTFYVVVKKRDQQADRADGGAARGHLPRRRRQAAVGVLGRTLGGRLRRLAVIDHAARSRGSGDIPAH